MKGVIESEKKKNLGIVAILIAMVVILTGCNNSNNLKQKSDNTNTKADIYITVLAFSDKNKIMVVSKVEGYYIVDYNGNKTSKIEGSCGSETTIMNNYIYTNTKVFDN